MQSLRLPPSEVSLILVNDPFIRKLNRHYRGKNRPTDVLSFPQHESLPKTWKKGSVHLGDIIISTTTARKQAKGARKKIENEFALLAIHGLLHLLGHDHAEPKEEKRMFALQTKLLKHVGYA